MTFINSNIPALKYGRDMEIEAVNSFADYIKNNHQYCIISEFGLVLDKTNVYWDRSRLVNVMFMLW